MCDVQRVGKHIVFSRLSIWTSTINSVHVPIEVGKFQSDSSRPNPMFYAIVCVKMSPECILSRLAKNNESFFFQAEDGIRDRSPSRGLGDVYKRQAGISELLFFCRAQAPAGIRRHPQAFQNLTFL